VKDLVESGRLNMVGIIQEQHPDRCRLFMQWKQMGWPILVDSLNLLEVAAVPITVAIDEFGVVREVGLGVDDVESFRSGFMETEFEPPAAQSAAGSSAESEWVVPSAPGPRADAVELARFASTAIRSGEIDRIDEAVDAYRRAVQLEPEDGWNQFRLGVALRKRFDSESRQSDDFQAAVNAWKSALDLDPNQYIWRRRIQQYGPRLDKPYPFYDWVPTAREELTVRGEVPHALLVEPAGAEFAAPLKDFEAAADVAEPDAKGRIHRDDSEFVRVETVAVPASLESGEAAQLHVTFRPNEENRAHWNNEVEGVEVWVQPPEGYVLDSSYRQLAMPAEAVSLETRSAEVEIRREWAPVGQAKVEGYALYYVCEDTNGTCLYRRQDFSILLEAR